MGGVSSACAQAHGETFFWLKGDSLDAFDLPQGQPVVFQASPSEDLYHLRLRRGQTLHVELFPEPLTGEQWFPGSVESSRVLSFQAEKRTGCPQCQRFTFRARQAGQEILTFTLEPPALSRPASRRIRVMVRVLSPQASPEPWKAEK